MLDWVIKQLFDACLDHRFDYCPNRHQIAVSTKRTAKTLIRLDGCIFDGRHIFHFTKGLNSRILLFGPVYSHVCNLCNLFYFEHFYIIQ